MVARQIGVASEDIVSMENVNFHLRDCLWITIMVPIKLFTVSESNKSCDLMIH
jgi:hypothetical protein